MVINTYRLLQWMKISIRGGWEGLLYFHLKRYKKSPEFHFDMLLLCFSKKALLCYSCNSTQNHNYDGIIICHFLESYSYYMICLLWSWNHNISLLMIATKIKYTYITCHLSVYLFVNLINEPLKVWYSVWKESAKQVHLQRWIQQGWRCYNLSSDIFSRHRSIETSK